MWVRDALEKLSGPQQVKKFPAIVKLEGSLAHSQVPDNRTYPEPWHFSLHLIN
jgi:hypothetical protein